MDLARTAARRNIQAFEREKLDAIIVNAAGCGSTLKEYGALLAGEAEWAARARLFSEKVKDLSEWLVGSPSSALPLSPSIPPGVKVTYHDACHLAHAQRITSAPRILVKRVAGDAFVELPEADVCCGSAGTYNLTEPAMAARLQERKLQNILRTGANIVVTTNPGCLLQIQAALNKAGAPIRVMHLADFLIERTSQATQAT
jgi:glycolate oxidase iron-sulfur subunit